jgi:hypothetical protein
MTTSNPSARKFPRHLSVHRENKTAAEANLTKLSSSAQFVPETFAAAGRSFAGGGLQESNVGAASEEAKLASPNRRPTTTPRGNRRI